MDKDNRFELLKEQHIEEINTHASLYRHVATGAELLSLVNADENKVFGVSLRTPPPDSTGLPHIMEHSVLCGSEKYPLKKPFVELIKGSLNTFLNAFTYPDKTCYPVASQNLQDFYNLVNVYMDAVFHPLIPDHILQQEGWHYELEGLQASLTYKGVVFNEMKGVYSNPDDLLLESARASLFPDTPYGVDSGGDPRRIPDLTYEQFRTFHERYYHPSNARFFFYGDDDPQERLSRMQGYLQGYSRLEVDSRVPLQPAFRSSKRLAVAFDPGEGTDDLKGMVVINWLFPEIRDPQKLLALQVLAHILIGTPASPLRKALIDSGLGEDLAGGGLETELRQMYFSIGLKGMAVDGNRDIKNETEVEELILGTLAQLVDQGISPDAVAASLNTVEFRLRENNTGSFPRGLLLMLRSLTSWLYQGDPISPLAFDRPLTGIKERLSGGERLFEGLLREHFLDNHHRTLLVMQPQPGYIQEQDDAEEERLGKVRSSLSEKELLAIIEQTRTLKRLQETPDSPEALAAVPTLKMSDLDRENKVIPLEVAEIAGCKTLFHDLPTHSIFYLDLGFDLHTLPQENLPYIPLFGRALVEIGTAKEDCVQLSQRIGKSTGGIFPTSFTSLVKETERGTAWLYLRGKATVSQAAELLNILGEILLTVKLDNRERFRQMLLEEKAEAEAALLPEGHRVVNSRLKAVFNEADWAQEQMSGVDYLFFLRQLVERVEKDWLGVLEQLETIRQVLVNRQGMISNITLEVEHWEKLQPIVVDLLEALPNEPTPPVEWRPPQDGADEGLVVPAQVNYVGKGADLYQLGYQPDGSVDVITNYLRTSWLWEQVRVQGGAYGGFCLFNRRSGVYTYLSYRDPNLSKTLENYDRTARFLRQLELSPEELTRAIIGAIGDLDAYQLPDAKGYTSMQRYLAGDTDESRQRWREQILSATAQDFRTFAELLELVNQRGHVVVMGSLEAIERANAESRHPDWLKMKKVL